MVNPSIFRVVNQGTWWAISKFVGVLAELNNEAMGVAGHLQGMLGNKKRSVLVDIRETCWTDLRENKTHGYNKQLS